MELWGARSQIVTADQYKFRSLGKNLEKPTCLSADKTKTLEGTDNCWAYALNNAKIDNIDQYVWLESSTVTCKKAGSDDELKGTANCKIGTVVECTDKQKERQAVTAEKGTTCIPTSFDWTAVA